MEAGGGERDASTQNTQSHANNCNTATLSSPITFPLHSRSVVVAASDGLWDNLWEHEMLEVLSRAMTATAAEEGATPLAHDGATAAPLKEAVAGALGGSAASGSPPRRAASAASALPAAPHHRRSGSGWAGWGLCGLNGRGLPDGRADGSPPSRRPGSAPPRASAAAAAATSDGSDAAADSDVSSSPQEQQQLKQQQQPPPPHPEALARRAAEALAAAAFRNARDDGYRSPWAAAAGRQGLLARLFARGGKMDDVTVVVAVVADAAALPRDSGGGGNGGGA